MQNSANLGDMDFQVYFTTTSAQIALEKNSLLHVTVQGDLAKMFLKLVNQNGVKFDHTVTKTTGKSHWIKVYSVYRYSF
jgi:hypothetical protein